jgi:hypothetical protein
MCKTIRVISLGNAMPSDRHLAPIGRLKKSTGVSSAWVSDQLSVRVLRYFLSCQIWAEGAKSWAGNIVDHLTAPGPDDMSESNAIRISCRVINKNNPSNSKCTVAICKELFLSGEPPKKA